MFPARRQKQVRTTQKSASFHHSIKTLPRTRMYYADQRSPAIGIHAKYAIHDLDLMRTRLSQLFITHVVRLLNAQTG